MEDQSKWNSNCSEENLNIEYEYINTNSIFYGIHKIKFQYEDNLPIEVLTKFDTGAKTSSIDYEVAKKIGVPENVLEAAKFANNQDIQKGMLKEDKKILLNNLSKEHKIELDTIKNATGITIRAYIPVTIYYNGRQIKTRANIADRSGLKAEALLGLKDML